VRNGFVGKLEFIRENHEEQEADCWTISSQGKRVVSFGM
jgi:hypothetical protein